MRLFGRLKMYLAGPELQLEKLLKECRLVDVQQFFLENDAKKVKSAPKKRKGALSREASVLQSKKVFNSFFDECFVRTEASYVTSKDVYAAYKSWTASHHAIQTLNAATLGKYIIQSKKIPCLRSKAMKNFQSFYLGIALKDTYKSKHKASMGEIYKFYKLNFVLDPTAEKIPLDNIFSVYLAWCKVQGIHPVRYHTFSKLTRLIMCTSHVIFLGKNSKGGRRRWLTGYKFEKINQK